MTETNSEENQNKVSTLTGNKSLTKKFVQKLYKRYAKIIQTLTLYIFCIQRLHKSEFCKIMNVQNMYIKFPHMYNNVQTVQNLYKVQTKSGLKLEMYAFCIYYTKCIHYTICIQILFESYMRLLMYVFCMYKNSIFFTFQIFVSTMTDTMTPFSVLFHVFVKFQE